MNRKRFLLRNRLLPLLVIAGLVVYQYYYAGNETVDARLQTATSTVEQAFAAQRSGLWLETGGRIVRVLKDDHEGARHQKFILELDGGHTVMVAHNIDLAERVPVRKGTRMVLRGRYEWNERGGVIHWTHHDPDGQQQGGWIEVGEVRYE
jgi:ligand-binding sensor domain-containing protein